MSSVVCEGDWVVFGIPGESSSCQYKMYQVKRSATLNIGKRVGKIKADLLVGLAYFSHWELGNASNLIPFVPDGFAEQEVDAEVVGDNRNLFDNNLSQNLTSEQIAALKHDPELSRKDLIESLVEGSDSFGTKTVFSQQKYLRKKSLKYRRVFKILPSTSYYLYWNAFKKTPERILGLRQDALSQILSLSNAHHGTKLLVYDGTRGLVALSLLERIHNLDVPNRRMDADISKVNESQTENSELFEMNEICNENNEIRIEGNEVQAENNAIAVEKTVQREENEGILATYENWDSWMALLKGPFPNILFNSSYAKAYSPVFCNFPIEHLFCDSISVPDDARNSKSALAKYKRMQRCIDLFQQHKYDALVLILDDIEPCSVAMELARGLNYSRPVVIYSQFRESLMRCYVEMMDSAQFVNVQLTESFLREYQTLPGRTHPTMRTFTSNGYILSAIKVLP